MTSSGSGFHALAAVTIAATCALLYAPALDAPFVLDDWDAVVYNPHTRWGELSFENLQRAIAGPRVKRPTAHVSFGISHLLAGAAPRAYRTGNIGIHAATSLLVYALALALMRRARALSADDTPDARAAPWAALAAALWFAAHPVQIQAVTYVVQRMTSLATLLYLGAIALWLLAQGRGAGARAALRALAVACGLLALGSKEIAITLPAALWLVHGAFVADWDRDWVRRTLPAVGGVLALGLGGLVWIAARPDPAWDLHDFGPGERVLSQARVGVFYLSLLVLPLSSRLNLLHEFAPSRSLVDPVTTLACWLVVAGLLAIAIAARRRRRWIAFGLLWLLLHLALEAGPLPLRMAFEHRLYLPLAGVCIAAAAVLFSACGSRRALAIGIAALATSLLGASTLARNEVWSDVDTLWVDAVEKSPGEWLAQMQSGSVLARAGRFDEAYAALDEASRLTPESPRPHNLRGAILRSQGRHDEALAAHHSAALLDPSDAKAYRAGAIAAAELGRLDEAAALLAAAYERSRDEQILHQLGRVRETQGRTEEALTLYRRAAAANPAYAAPRVAAAQLLARGGRAEDAAALLAEAVRAARAAGDEDEAVQIEALRAKLGADASAP